MGEGKVYVYLVIIGALFYCIQLIFSFSGYLGFIGQYYIWFCLGSLVCYYKNDTQIWNKLNNSISVFIIGCILSICFVLWKPNIIFLNMATVLCIITLYLIVPDGKNEVMLKISKNSFSMYLLHSPMIYITFKFFNNCNPVWVVLLNFVIWGGVSFILSNLIRETRFKWIIGE